METVIETLTEILKEIKQWEHEPRPATVEKLKTLTEEMYTTIF